MNKLFRGLAAALFFVLMVGQSHAQVNNIPGVYLSGSAPTGFSTQQFKYNCDGATPSSAHCWPLVQIYDGATAAGVNSGDNGANVHIVGCAVGICGLPTITSNAVVVGAITTPMTGTTATSLISAVTSQHIYVTSIACQNTSATGTLVQVLDGASTVIGNLAAGPTLGGDNRQGSQPLFVTTAGNALEAKDVTTGASVTCNASGYSSAN